MQPAPQHPPMGQPNIPGQPAPYPPHAPQHAHPAQAPQPSHPGQPAAHLVPHGVQPGPQPPHPTLATQFFNPWEPPPGVAPPPEDPSVTERIHVTARYALKSGSQFIDMMKQRHHGDPNFAFLNGGDGYQYWRWTLFCSMHSGCDPSTNYAGYQAQAQAAAPAVQPHPAAPAPHAAPPINYQLSPDFEASFSQVLQQLNGSKDSIKASSQWFMSCTPQAAGLSLQMARRLVTLPEFDKQLHIIYLANDVLFKSLGQRPAGSTHFQDAVANPMLPLLGSMLAAAYKTGGKTEEVLARIKKILGFWTERKVYDAAAVSTLELTMISLAEGNPAEELERAAAAAASGPPAQIPGAVGAGQGQPWMSQPTVSGQAGAPQQQPPAGGMPWQQPPPQHMPPGAPPPHGYGGPPPGLPPAGPWGGPGQPPPGQFASQPQMPGGWPPHHPPPGAYPPHGAMPPGHHPPGPPQQPRPDEQWRPPVDPAAEFAAAAAAAKAAAAASGVGANGGGMSTSGAAHPPPPPERKPVSSFHFPPGLLPKLCADKAHYTDSYAPILPRDIEREGLPPPPEKDNYLAARLDRFYADIQAYRPGAVPGAEEYDEELARRQRDRDRDRDHDFGSRKNFYGQNRERHGMQADGSFSGPGGKGSQYAGLGASTAYPSRKDEEPEQGDMYATYRRTRSYTYHDGAFKSAANMFMPKSDRGR